MTCPKTAAWSLHLLPPQYVSLIQQQLISLFLLRKIFYTSTQSQYSESVISKSYEHCLNYPFPIPLSATDTCVRPGCFVYPPPTSVRYHTILHSMQKLFTTLHSDMDMPAPSSYLLANRCQLLLRKMNIVPFSKVQ